MLRWVVVQGHGEATEALDEHDWPPVGHSEHSWHSAMPDDLVPRRVREEHRGPYRAAALARIAELPLRLTTETAAVVDDASTAVVRFDAEVGRELVPYDAVLLRSESASSSQIEHLTSGARAIALAEVGAPGERTTTNAELIVANSSAMRAALDRADDLGEPAVLAMHRALLERHEPATAGRWRQEQVWIGGSGYGPHRAAFVPPHHDEVPPAMADLVAFVRRTDIPVLAHAALAHAHFETIHPFTDGNGRTGRALLQAMLRAGRLTPSSTLPVSAGLLTDTEAYFRALTDYRAGDAGPIVVLIAEASLRAVASSRRLVDELRSVRAAWHERIGARRDAVVWRVADLLLQQPVITAGVVQERLGPTSANAHRALRQLVEAGVVSEVSGRRRGRYWAADDVLRALDDFAARSGRRGRPSA